jgi:transmembrane sensor
VAEPSWREEAAQGHHAEAYALLGSSGLEREVGRAASSEDLFTLADVARLSGHPERARAPLARLLELYPHDPHDARAPLAAATLGRIELDLGQPNRAARAFERALGLGAPLALEEDLRARLVESWVRAGDLDAARAAGVLYRKRFPEGRRKAEVDRWLASPAPSTSLR